MTTTTSIATLRSVAEPVRNSAKSGTVYAPERRSGAATNSSSPRYPAVKPTGYQRASAPYLAISPATPRNDAAERYSPEMAAAFHCGPMLREATRKSDVVLDSRIP